MLKHILEKKPQNSLVNFYITHEVIDRIVIVKKYDDDKINTIKKYIDKYPNSTYIQSEKYYANLVNIEIKNQDGNEITQKYSRIIGSDSLMIDINMIVYKAYCDIKEEYFPKLSSYDYICNKIIQTYKIGNINIVFETFNSETSIHLDLTNVTIEDEEQFHKLCNLL